MKHFIFILFCFLISPANLLRAQSSDNLNGTFTNPVLWADFPDPDAIRVGDTYYMVSTSMHYFPGGTVLASKDLVNWHIASNAIESLKVHPFYDMDGGTRYARGQWATSIRYFNNTFYLLFNTLDEGAFMCTASSAYGPWNIHPLKTTLYDPGLFIDQDQRMYVIHGHTDISATELDLSDFTIKTPAKLIHTGYKSGLEGNHCYHIGEYYYILCTYGTAQGNQVCLRSKNIYGPYEEKVILDDDANLYNMGLHQGCMLDTPDGSYWSLIFQDRAGLGRIPFLLPVSWENDWPLLSPDSKGLVTFQKPHADNSITPFPTTDEFDNPELSLQWQFNHHPDHTKYSLKERIGYLRLRTATRTAELRLARNTICQRIFGPISIATTEIELQNMKNGDECGLTIFQDPYASILVRKENEAIYKIQMRYKEQIIEQTTYFGKKVYLQAEVDGITDRARFYYSPNNKDFRRLGDEFRMEFNLTVFCGNRFGLFNYATENTGGYIDVNWFRVRTKTEPINYQYATKVIEAEMYDHISNGDMAQSPERVNFKNQDISFKSSGWVSYNMVDFGNDPIIQFSMRYMIRESNAKLTLRKNDENGEVIASYDLPRSAARTTFYGNINKPDLKGVEKLIVAIEKRGTQSLNIDWFRFEKEVPGRMVKIGFEEDERTLNYETLCFANSTSENLIISQTGQASHGQSFMQYVVKENVSDGKQNRLTIKGVKIKPYTSYRLSLYIKGTNTKDTPPHVIVSASSGETEKIGGNTFFETTQKDKWEKRNVMFYIADTVGRKLAERMDINVDFPIEGIYGVDQIELFESCLWSSRSEKNKIYLTFGYEFQNPQSEKIKNSVSLSVNGVEKERPVVDFHLNNLVLTLPFNIEDTDKVTVSFDNRVAWLLFENPSMWGLPENTPLNSFKDEAIVETEDMPVAIEDILSTENLKICVHKNILFISGGSFTKLSIYATDGKLSKYINRIVDQIDISNLIPGLYILKTDTGFSAKFIR